MIFLILKSAYAGWLILRCLIFWYWPFCNHFKSWFQKSSWRLFRFLYHENTSMFFLNQGWILCFLVVARCSLFPTFYSLLVILYPSRITFHLLLVSCRSSFVIFCLLLAEFTRGFLNVSHFLLLKIGSNYFFPLKPFKIKCIFSC